MTDFEKLFWMSFPFAAAILAFGLGVAVLVMIDLIRGRYGDGSCS